MPTQKIYNESKDIIEGRKMNISNEAQELLKEIIDNIQNGDYWRERFEGLSKRDDSILRGCFRELREAGMISVQYANNYPYVIEILKDGYLYEEHINNISSMSSSEFEKKLNELLERAANLQLPFNKTVSVDRRIHECQQKQSVWMNDVEIFYNKYLKEHPLADRIKTLLFHRKYDEIVACLQSVQKDREYIDQVNGVEKIAVPAYKVKGMPMYDVFISHANKDKETLIEDLYKSLKKLGIDIFYDKESLEWGDNWKDKILEGVQKAEFAIIVISTNFFGREWTEKELYEFMNRQNRNGQKLILPILCNITVEQLREQYPTLADIQAIDSAKYSCDQIALMFAKQLIKRLKM